MVGFRVYAMERLRTGDFLPSSDRTWVIAAAVVGAAAGGKILNWFEDPFRTLAHWKEPAYWLGGKTIIGALLGGTILVEWAKRRLGITRRTGDLFAIPLALSIAIGRVGCLLSGISDDTYGYPTKLPWGFDFGDGILRHPLPIYEILGMALLTLVLIRAKHRPRREGDLYRIFLLGYLTWRLIDDSLKPDPRFGGLTVLQWVCVAALICYWRDLKFFLFPTKQEEAYG
jgi:prolipoprotein diacylglyceryltransferase